MKAPPGTSLSNGDYACFQILNDVDDDTFTENMVNVFLQFSLFSGNDSASDLTTIDSNLSIMIKDKTWPMDGATVVHSLRKQGDGPDIIYSDLEAGTEEYWLTTIDYEVLINRD